MGPETSRIFPPNSPQNLPSKNQKNAPTSVCRSAGRKTCQNVSNMFWLFLTIFAQGKKRLKMSQSVKTIFDIFRDFSRSTNSLAPLRALNIGPFLEIRANPDNRPLGSRYRSVPLQALGSPCGGPFNCLIVGHSPGFNCVVCGVPLRI